MPKITAEIRGWTIADEGPFTISWGDIYGDTKKRWRDGTSFHTSAIKNIEETSDAFIVTTLNSIYELKKDQSLQVLLNEKEDERCRWKNLS